MNIYDKYEAVIGLEVHAQLATKSKAFSRDSAAYGAPPNTQISPITLGHPGTLPMLNKRQVEFAVMLGLACHSNITEVNRFARKNYFYADLPKGYQISQFDTPICTGGYVRIDVEGKDKNIELTRIHMEEDAGKSMHDQDPYYTLIDLNRAGVPLLEIVTEPVLRSADEAYAYLTQVRKLVRYLEICDGNMEEGSLRCDANISVRIKGVEKFGEKVEVKNMNSIRNVKRAIDYEIKRQIEAIEAGEVIDQDTRSFDAVKGTTFTMRSKELAHDYRYFPEPDLPPVRIKADYIEKIKQLMPPLPEELYQRFRKEFELSDYDAQILTDEKEIALYFNELITFTKNYKAAANWVMGAVKSYLNEQAIELTEFVLKPQQIAEIINLIDSGKISNSAATQNLFPAMVEQPNSKAADLAEKLNLFQQSDESVIDGLVDEVIAAFPEKVEEYKNGKKGLLGMFMGQVMKKSKGKADPQLASKLLEEKLN
ncbi:MAG: Asp-tRNA(Asn)/Glu-tRNA(Gln) amidotransferase subunit GatB [Chitinophagales bacterium]